MQSIPSENILFKFGSPEISGIDAQIWEYERANARSYSQIWYLFRQSLETLKFMINVMQMMIFATGMVCTCQDNILKMLERVATFNDMDQEYVNLLKPLFERYSCPSGFTVIEQGQPADYLYVIVDGKAQVTYKPYDGTPITVAHVEKDGVFGWSAVVGSRMYTSSVTAIEDLDTFRIHGNELRRLCVDHPEAGKEILERIASVVSSRWSNSHDQVKSILMQGMKC